MSEAPGRLIPTPRDHSVSRDLSVFRSVEHVPAGFGPSVAAIGNFDGVHLGHREILSAVVDEARALGVRAVAITFDPHPEQFLRPAQAPQLLTPMAERLRLLALAGIDAVVVLPFDAALARLPALAFVRGILVEALGVRALHEGGNFRFGHRARQAAPAAGNLGFHGQTARSICSQDVPDSRRRDQAAGQARASAARRSGQAESHRQARLARRLRTVSGPPLSRQPKVPFRLGHIPENLRLQGFRRGPLDLPPQPQQKLHHHRRLLVHFHRLKVQNVRFDGKRRLAERRPVSHVGHRLKLAFADHDPRDINPESGKQPVVSRQIHRGHQ